MIMASPYLTAERYHVATEFEFDETRTAEENISSFLAFIESTDKVFGPLLQKHIARMLPLPEANVRSTARASFNAEVKKLLDAILEAAKSKDG
jgi:hypothetical protein